jgi:hypothetical protein
MSQVIIDNAPIYEIADILRDKAVITGKVHHKDMPAAIQTLHGYRTTARATTYKPNAYAKTQYSVKNNPHTTIAIKNINYLHAEPSSVFDVDSDLIFATAAAKNTSYLHAEPHPVVDIDTDFNFVTTAAKAI